MSKQSKAKEGQGYRERDPSCRNCKEFKNEKMVMGHDDGGWDRTWLKETNMRCGIANFRVNRESWCKMHDRKEEP